MTTRPTGTPGTRAGPAGRSVPPVGAEQAAGGTGNHAPQADVAALIPMVRRIVAARVQDGPTAEDLVQETLVRVLAAAPRVEPGMLESYAIVTARNVVASLWRERDRHRRNQHRVVDLLPEETHDDGLVAREEQAAVAQALARLSRAGARHAPGPRGRRSGHPLTRRRAGIDRRRGGRAAEPDAGTAAGGVPAGRWSRPNRRPIGAGRSCSPCRAATAAGSGRSTPDGTCWSATCARGSASPLMERGQPRDDEVCIPIRSDADIVAARQAGRELAARLGFSRTDLTLIATAVSEVARNIVRFAGSGEVVIELVDQPRQGVRVLARDTGPGIPDVEKALKDGYSTYNGLGLGLPGARRLMDEFAIVSEIGRGTTVTMTKWCGER